MHGHVEREHALQPLDRDVEVVAQRLEIPVQRVHTRIDLVDPLRQRLRHRLVPGLHLLPDAGQLGVHLIALRVAAGRRNTGERQHAHRGHTAESPVPLLHGFLLLLKCDLPFRAPSASSATARAPRQAPARRPLLWTPRRPGADACRLGHRHSGSSGCARISKFCCLDQGPHGLPGELVPERRTG